MIRGRGFNASLTPFRVVVSSTPRACAVCVPNRAASVVQHVSIHHRIVGILWNTGIVTEVKMCENVVKEVVNCVVSNKYISNSDLIDYY